MPKIDLSELPVKTGSIYPAPHDEAMRGRSSIRLSDAYGLGQFGVNITILEPGARSSLRHWHETQDEFVIVLSGTCVLIDDNGETPLATGECAAFPAGDPNGHCIANNSTTEARFLVVGTRTPTETAHYSDIDMMIHMDEAGAAFSHRDGTPYSGEEND